MGGLEFPDIAGISPPRTDIESSVSITGKVASKSSKCKEKKVNKSTRSIKSRKMELLEDKMSV